MRSWRRTSVLRRRAPHLEAGYPAGVVPGNFDGWTALLDKYGTMTLADVFVTAVEYADRGFPVDSYLRETLDDACSNLEIFPTTAVVFVPNGTLPRTDDDRRRRPAPRGMRDRVLMGCSRAGIGSGWVPPWPALRLDIPEKRPFVAQDGVPDRAAVLSKGLGAFIGPSMHN